VGAVAPLAAPISVGVLTASVSRRAGGLFWALPPLVQGLERDGCAVRVFSVADAATNEDAAHWVDTRLDLHSRLGPRAFAYAPRLGRALDAAGLDLVHTHGLWMYPSVAASRWAARWKRPLVVSAHGMLDPWAVRNAAWKKRLAGWLFEHRHLERAACLHALNGAEYQAIRGFGLSNPVAVIPNGVDLPDAGEPSARPDWAADLDGRRVLLFLGRLHPKKGLANLLQAWASVQRQTPERAAGWMLAIAGWDQGGHEARLRQLVEALDLGATVRFVGPQFGPQKAASLAVADAFVLPSLSEGLPMAVLEAWAHRLPVLMTRACNLPEGFAAGAALELADDRMAEALAAFLALPEAERRAMGGRGRRLAASRFAWDAIAAQMAGVYRWLVEGGERPPWVRVQ
jgi:glycosyltransferase involved in cell wall biosynthesis